MKLGQKVSKNTRRKKEATDFWIRVATDFNTGLSPDQIADRYTNPRTNKNYSLKHIYWVLRQMNITTFS